MTDRKLLLERLERLAIVLDELMPRCAELVRDAIASLKEQKAETEKLIGFINGFSKDAVPVVRCKDCKHRGIHIFNKKLSMPQSKKTVDDEWFCADGKRR